MAKKGKAKWVQDGSKLTLTIKAPRKARRPVMMYSIEFNFQPKVITDKGYSRKKKHKKQEE